jgi:hypothetical protein
MLIRKTVASNGVHAPRGIASWPEELQAYPATYEFLTVDSWPDGGKRTRGTVTLFNEEGRWKCWINDKDQGRSACVTAASLPELLAAVEYGLVEDSLDWRRARPQRDRRV